MVVVGGGGGVAHEGIWQFQNSNGLGWGGGGEEMRLQVQDKGFSGAPFPETQGEVRGEIWGEVSVEITHFQHCPPKAIKMSATMEHH